MATSSPPAPRRAPASSASPDVLPEEHRCRRARLELGGGVHEVLLAEQPGRFEPEGLETAPDILVDVAELECCD